MYGVATWNGFRVAANAPGFIRWRELSKLLAKPERRSQLSVHSNLPFIWMPEALELPQPNVEWRIVSVLEAAQVLGITVMASASILQDASPVGCGENRERWIIGD